MANKTEYSDIETKKLDYMLCALYDKLKEKAEHNHEIMDIVSNIVEMELEIESRSNK